MHVELLPGISHERGGPMGAKRWRCLVLAEYEVWRRGIAHILDDVEAVACYRFAEAEEGPPEGFEHDLVVISPEVSAERAIGVLHPLTSVPAIAILASNRDEDFARAAAIPAAGYISHADLNAASLASLLDRLRADECVMPAALATFMKRARTVTPSDALTAREIEVVRLLARGSTTKGVAATLGISPHSAKRHVASLMTKLGASTRTQAVSRALELGMLDQRRSPWDLVAQPGGA